MSEYHGLERRHAYRERQKTRRMLAAACLFMAATSLGCLVFSFQAAERARAAEEDYRAGMYRGAVNRIINCRQLEDLAIMLKMIGVKQKPEPLCDDVDLKRWHDLVDGKPHP
jgi:hypothetical protein